MGGSRVMGREGVHQMELRTLDRIMHELGHAWLDVFKVSEWLCEYHIYPAAPGPMKMDPSHHGLQVDIEGAEWGVLQGLLLREDPLPFTQMQVPHAWMQLHAGAGCTHAFTALWADAGAACMHACMLQRCHAATCTSPENINIMRQVEYHVLKPDKANKNERRMTPRAMLHIMRALQDRGLRVFNVEPNYWRVSLSTHPAARC